MIAESQTLADQAAQKVVVKYKDIQKPVLSVDEAIAAEAFHPSFIQPATIGNPEGIYSII